jgi:hypothetical protein
LTNGVKYKKPPGGEGFLKSIKEYSLFQLTLIFSGHHIGVGPKVIRVGFPGGEAIGFGYEFPPALFIHGLLVGGDLGVGTTAYTSAYCCFGSYTFAGALFSAGGR